MTTVILIVVAAAVAGLAVAVAMGRGRGRGEELAELSARLKQLAETYTLAQGQIGERLQAQERALSESLDKRLGMVADRLTEGLSKSSKETQATMGELGKRLAVIDAAQKNIAELSTQMVGLQDILSNKQARGAFGEVQLKNLVEDVLPPDAYEFQATIGDNRRVDCLIRLPNPPGPISIDAKFPLESYTLLRNATDEAGRTVASRAFTAAMQVHLRDIHTKYIVSGETADCALLFLPSEAIYYEIQSNFPNIVEESRKQRVFIVSPDTLWFVLNTLNAILRDVRMRTQAHVIQREVGLLLKDVGLLKDRVANLQSHFGQANKDIEQIIISADKIDKRGNKISDVELDDSASTAVSSSTPSTKTLL
ncbi:MAG: DNA recombination protein RmuC [Alphaproteobacteria bacterium]